MSDRNELSQIEYVVVFSAAIDITQSRFNISGKPTPGQGFRSFQLLHVFGPLRGFFLPDTGDSSCRYPGIRPERGPIYLPHTLTILPMPFIIKLNRRQLRPATMEAKATEYLFEPPTRRFFYSSLGVLRDRQHIPCSARFVLFAERRIFRDA